MSFTFLYIWNHMSTRYDNVPTLSPLLLFLTGALKRNEGYAIVSTCRHDVSCQRRLQFDVLYMKTTCEWTFMLKLRWNHRVAFSIAILSASNVMERNTRLSPQINEHIKDQDTWCWKFLSWLTFDTHRLTF